MISLLKSQPTCFWHYFINNIKIHTSLYLYHSLFLHLIVYPLIYLCTNFYYPTCLKSCWKNYIFQPNTWTPLWSVLKNYDACCITQMWKGHDLRSTPRLLKYCVARLECAWWVAQRSHHYLRDCNNWWGITLLLIPGKAFCIVLLNQMKWAVDILLQEEQAGFRSGRSCTSKYSLSKTSLSSALNTRCDWRLILLTSRRHLIVYIAWSFWKTVHIYGSLTVSSMSSEPCMTIPSAKSRW